MRWIGWTNLGLGLWLAPAGCDGDPASAKPHGPAGEGAPWVLGYEHPGVSVANDRAVGLIIFGLATVNVWIKDRRMHVARAAVRRV